MITNPPLMFTASLLGAELSPLHSLAGLYIEVCIFSPVLDMLIQYGLSLL